MMEALKSVCKAFEVSKAGFGPLCRENSMFCRSFFARGGAHRMDFGTREAWVGSMSPRGNLGFCKENDVLVCKSDALGHEGGVM